MADLYINTDNFKLQTHSRDRGNTGYEDGNTILALGKGLQEIEYTTSLDDIRTKNTRQNNPTQARLVINDNGAYFEGDVYANNGYFHGNVHATNFILDGATAVSNFNSAITGSSAYTNIPSVKEKLYYMSTSNTAPSEPTSKVSTSSTNSTNTWSLTMPQYPNGTTLYYYYTCIQTTTRAGVTTWSTPVRENQATEASTITEQFKANGLLTNETWGGHTFPVALTSTGSMLIGANSGIWIAKPSSSAYTDGAAIAITQAGGIQLAGSSLTIDSYSTINISSSNFTINSNPGSGGNYFYVGTSADTAAANEKYVKFTQAGELEIKGKITATELTIGTQSAEAYIQAHQNNPDLSDYVTYASFDVEQGSEIPAAITAKVWDAVGNGTSLKMTKADIKIGTFSNNTMTNGVTINTDGLTVNAKAVNFSTASTFTVGSSTGTGGYLSWNSSESKLTIKGNITATSGKIGNWTLSNGNLTNNETGLNTVFLGSTTVNSIEWIMYAGATYAEGGGSDSDWTGERPSYWAPFRLNTRGELYSEILCLGNGPANVTGDTTAGGDGWANYVGKLWLFVKYDDNDYRWECIDSTALWKAVTRSPANSSNGTGNDYTPASTPSGSSGCFIAGTLVNLPGNKKIPIEDLKVGDKILSYNIYTKTLDESEVQLLQILKDKIAYRLHLSNNMIITVTDSHPFLTPTGWKALNPAKGKEEHGVNCETLKEHDELILINNKKVYIKEIEYRNVLMHTTVYNLGVLPHHTFIVDDIVVHNRFVNYDVVK